MLSRSVITLLGLLWAGLPAQPAAAFDMDVRDSLADYLDFAMWISNNETTLHDNNVSTRIKYRRIGVTAFDISPDRTVQLGLHIGVSFTNQDDISATQGLSLNGTYIGVGMHIPFVEQDRLKLRLDLDYIYQHVDGASDTETVTCEWHEYDGGLLATVPLGHFQLLGGVYYQRFDATQTATGTIQQTLFLDNEDTLQQRFGIDYNTGPGEHVGLHYHSGASSGIQLKFQKLF